MQEVCLVEWLTTLYPAWEKITVSMLFDFPSQTHQSYISKPSKIAQCLIRLA